MSADSDAASMSASASVTSSTLKAQIWVHDLRVGGSELSLLNELQNLANPQMLTSVVVVGRDMTLAERFENSGIEVIQLGQGSPFTRLSEIIRILNLHKPDVVNTMLFWPNISVRPLARIMGIPVLSTLVNSDYGRSQRMSSPHGSWAVIVAQIADAVTAKFASRFRAVSDDVATVMSKRLWVRRSRISTLHRGRNLLLLGRRTDERRAAARELLGVGDRTVFVCVGRQDRQKAQEIAVAAFARIAAQQPNVVLLLVGRSGESSEKIRRAISGSPIQPLDVRQLGEITNVSDILAAADFLLFPSRWEGLPGTVIEAMALEVPLLLSDIPGSREVTGGNALFFEPDSEEACFQTLKKCFDESYPENFVATARERCERMFDVSAISAQLGELLKSVAQK